MTDSTYALKIPIEIDNSGNFLYISNVLQNVRQNLKMIILTNPGEKLMDPNYGLGIRKYLFEPARGSVDISVTEQNYAKVNLKPHQEQILIELTKQVNKYNPEILIRSVQAVTQDNILLLTIKYNFKGYIDDSIEVSVNL